MTAASLAAPAQFRLLVLASASPRRRDLLAQIGLVPGRIDARALALLRAEMRARSRGSCTTTNAQGCALTALGALTAESSSARIRAAPTGMPV